MAGSDDDDTTHPGVEHKLLSGPADASVLANLGATVAFYASRLEQLAGELRRAPLSEAQRRTLCRDLREVAKDAAAAAEKLEEEGEEGGDSKITVELDE